MGPTLHHKLITISIVAFIWEQCVAEENARGSVVRRAVNPQGGLRRVGISKFEVGANKHEVAAPQTKLVIGFHTSHVPRYVKMNAAQFETWAEDFPKDRVLVAGGPRDNVGARPNGPCPDDRDQTCKDAAIFYAAAQRVRETGSEWFLGIHEDAYVRLDSLAKALSVLDTERPVIHSGVGCGQGWEFHKESKNGTIPKPKERWTDVPYSCRSVYEQGGLCTGPAYFINRAALLKVTKGFDRVEDFIKEYMSHWHSTTEPVSKGTDRLLSCVLRDNHVAMEHLPHGLNWFDVWDIDAGWQKRPTVLEKFSKQDGANVLNVMGTDGVASARERIPTFLREAHKYLAA